MKRWFDLATDQQRSLRVRSLTNALRGGMPGAYLQIGSIPTEQLQRVSHLAALELQWLTAEEAQAAASCATSLRRLSGDAFDWLSRHGSETAHWNNLAYPYYRESTGTH
jgi:hypothetical protein